MPTKSKKNKKIITSNASRILVVIGVLLIVVILILVKNQNSKTSSAPDLVTPADVAAVSLLPPGTPEEQVDWSIKNNQAVFVFFHSDNCQSCIDMMKIVDEVYPEFQDSVPLIDVNVYDEVNQNLLRRGGINTIPTQLFLDSTGEGKIAMGIMSQDQLREQLSILAGDK